MTSQEYQSLREQVELDYQKKIEALDNFYATFGSTECVISPIAKTRRPYTKRKSDSGEPKVIEVKCFTCKKDFSVKAGMYNYRKSIGKTPKFCSKKCIRKTALHKEVENKIREKRAPFSSDYNDKLRDAVLKAHPVKRLQDMSPEEQAELKKRYEK